MLRLFGHCGDLSMTRGTRTQLGLGRPGAFLSEVWRIYGDTMGTQVLAAGLGVTTGLLLARLLGPQGRGELAAVTLWPLTITFLASLGLNRAAIFFSAQHRQDVSPVASTCLAVGGVQSLVVIAAGALIIPIVLRADGPVSVMLGLAFLACAPLILAPGLQASLLLGHLQTRPYNLCQIAAPACYTAGVVALFALHRATVRGVVGFQLEGYAVASVVAYRLVVRKLRPSWHWERSVSRKMLSYGLKVHAGEVVSRLNQRLDQLLISVILPSRELGLYVAAVAFADSLLIIPRGVGAVTLARGSGCDRAEARRAAKRSLLVTLLWIVPAGAALWFLVPVAIPRLLGAAFRSSVLPCRILILGACAAGVSTVLFEVVRSANRPQIPSWAELAGLAVTVALLLALLGPYGIVGAAIASSAAYTATLTFMVVYLIFKGASDRFDATALQPVGEGRASGHE
jgi:O-antigen/teichoic acid export membrane protein